MMSRAKSTVWLVALGGVLGVLALVGILAISGNANAPAMGNDGGGKVQAAPLVVDHWPVSSHAQQDVIICTLATTTTDSLPNINSFADAAAIASYTGLALAAGGKGQQIEPEADYFRLDNAIPGWEYRIQAIPDGVGNYNLAMVAYDLNQQAILTDTNPFDGNSASITLAADSVGPYFFKIYQYSAQCSGGTYRLVVSNIAPSATPSPSPTPTPATATPTPAPTWITGFDQYEPNFDFDHATTIAPEVTYNLNFVPWGGADIDNDYFKLWVKPGLFFTCETFDLDPGVDTNIIIYDANRNVLGGNDDRQLGDYSSRVSYYATYEGYLYLLVGHGSRLSLPDSRESDYKLTCSKSVPGSPTPVRTATPEVGKDPTPAPTNTPEPPSSPVATPTQQAVGGGAVDLIFRPLTTPTPVAPTPTPSGFRTFRLLIYYDANNDGALGAGEGVPGFFVRVLEPNGNVELARGYTDDQGQLSFTVPTPGAVRLLVPLLGLDRFVEPATPEVKVRIAPLPLPDIIP
ncbi:MAG: hypothetical protein JXB35_02745 [Anaerolineae bacterium]|nr:hypothetical protein [Anaerolineae bacterium]